MKFLILYFSAFALLTSITEARMQNAHPVEQHSGGDVQGNVTWFENCPGVANKGSIKGITLTNCDAQRCTLEAGEALRLVLNFVAGDTYDVLNYRVSLLNNQTSTDITLAEGTGTLRVDQGLEYSIGNNFHLYENIPAGQNYSMKIHRFKDNETSTEVCAIFSISSVTNDIIPTTTTTEEPPTTESVPITTSRPIYECNEPGIFPDPHDCAIFHVCTLYPNGTIWDQQLHCADETVYCDRLKYCEYEPECPCTLPRF